VLADLEPRRVEKRGQLLERLRDLTDPAVEQGGRREVAAHVQEELVGFVRVERPRRHGRERRGTREGFLLPAIRTGGQDRQHVLDVQLLARVPDHSPDDVPLEAGALHERVREEIRRLSLVDGLGRRERRAACP
jgi:hypothetical protein